jgi:hypothetical protein
LHKLHAFYLAPVSNGLPVLVSIKRLETHHSRAARPLQLAYKDTKWRESVRGLASKLASEPV